MVLLVDEAEAAAFRRNTGHVLSMESYSSRSDPGVAGDGFEQGGLTRAGRPDDERIATARHREGDVAKIEAADPDRDGIELDHARSGGWSRRTRANTTSATSRSNTAAGTAAERPKAVNRS